MTETSDDENKVFEEFWNQPDKDWMKEPYFVKGKIAGLEMAIEITDQKRKDMQNVYDNQMDKFSEFAIIHINVAHVLEDVIDNIRAEIEKLKGETK